MRTAVVGHVEWVQFARVARLPLPGDIAHASQYWEEPGGGGPGAAVQLARLSAHTDFFTALGDDDYGRRAEADLVRRGLKVQAAFRDASTRRAFTHVDGEGERTITVIGRRMGPRGEDSLPWQRLGRSDATYFTAGDIGALRHSRRSRILVATSRARDVLTAAHVPIDALVGSNLDPAEAYQAGMLDPPPRLVVMTEGSRGGFWWKDGEAPVRFDAAPLPGPVADRYGAGDSFAGGLTFALAVGASPPQAIAFAAKCGAASLTGRGPYEGQRTSFP